MEEPPPPEPRPRPQLVPDLAVAAPSEVPSIAVKLDLDPELFADGPPTGAAGVRGRAPWTRRRPRLVRSEPPYPYRARQRGIEGDVRVRLLVRADGSVGRVEILSADPPGVFDDTVMQTVPRWTFAPGKIGGRAVASWVVTTVHFTLGGGGR